MRFLTLILLSLLLAACGNEAADDTAGKEDEESVFHPLVESVDKAKAVEDTVLQQKEDMDDAMKQLEEGGEDPDQERN